MAFLTVTPEQLRALATTCSTQADAVGTVGSTVNSNITGVDWAALRPPSSSSRSGRPRTGRT